MKQVIAVLACIAVCAVCMAVRNTAATTLAQEATQGWKQIEIQSRGDLVEAIQTCFRALPFGGTCDARSLSGKFTSRGFRVPARTTLLLGSVQISLTSPIILDDEASLIGSGWQTELKAFSHRRAFPDGGSALITNSDAQAGNTGVRISSLKIDANASHNPGLSYISGVRLIRCSHSTVESVWATGASGSSAFGVRFEHGAFNRILHNVAENSANLGFSIAGENGFLLQGNIAQQNGGNGFDVGTSSAEGRIVDNDAVGNGMLYKEGAGIGIDGAGDISITGNTVRDTISPDGAGIVVSNPQRHLLITNNRIQHNKGDGIALINNVADGVIESNIITDNAMRGLLLNGASDMLIAGNLIINNSRSADQKYDGILITATRDTFNSRGNLITGNIFRGSTPSSQHFAVREDATARGSIRDQSITNNDAVPASVSLLPHSNR